MSKISIYKNPAYYLSYGKDDPLLLDVEVKIIKQEVGFSVEIIKCIVHQSEEFVLFLIQNMSTDGMNIVSERVSSLLVAELLPSLFTLFYAGEIQVDETK